MKSKVLLLLITVFTLTAIGCAVPSSHGRGLLPTGMSEARVPAVENGGYVYFSADPPAKLAEDTLRAKPVQRDPDDPAPRDMVLTSATLVIGNTPHEFGGALTFGSQSDSFFAWSLLRDRTETEPLWGRLASPNVLVTKGEGTWAEETRQALDAGLITSIPAHDPNAWSLVTHLPAEPPVPPAAAGTLMLSNEIVGPLSEQAEIDLDELAEAFEMVRVDRVGFGIYADGPLRITSGLDRSYLKEVQSSVLFVSQSTYPGGLVSFMLSVVADKADMELMELGGSNARYRTFDDLHVVIANRGSILYAVVAWSLEDAQALMLSALTG